jgi:uncharacterized protein YcbK (DUF882 family)
MVLAGVLNISSSVGLEFANHSPVPSLGTISSSRNCRRSGSLPGMDAASRIRFGRKTQTCALARHTDVDRNRPSSPGFLVTQTFGISQMRECFSSVIASATLLLLLSLPTFAHDRIHESHLGRHHHRSIAHNVFGWHDHVPRHSAISHSRLHHAYDNVSVSRSCLNRETRQLLDRVEAEFGAVQIVSTCRPGAVIAGTHHASMHRYGRAVDFNAPPGRKAAIVRWLAANNPGGTMTYASMGHIHMDTGPYHFVSLGAGARGASRHYAHVNKLTRVRLARHGRGYGLTGAD